MLSPAAAHLLGKLYAGENTQAVQQYHHHISRSLYQQAYTDENYKLTNIGFLVASGQSLAHTLYHRTPKSGDRNRQFLYTVCHLVEYLSNHISWGDAAAIGNDLMNGKPLVTVWRQLPDETAKRLARLADIARMDTFGEYGCESPVTKAS